jgi:hypothetical protein
MRRHLGSSLVALVAVAVGAVVVVSLQNRGSTKVVETGAGPSAGQPVSAAAPYRETATSLKTKPAPVAAAAAVPSLPGGSEEPYDLVGDPTGSGVWFLASDPSSIHLYHWTSSDALQSWVIGSSAHMALGLNSALAVGANGVAWAGVGANLFRVDTSSGTVSSVSLPDVPAVSAVLNMFPPSLRGLPGWDWITGLAVDPSGNVAIARNGGNAIQVYDPTLSAFTDVGLPANTGPEAAVANANIAFDSSGVLGVALLDYSNFGTTHAAVSELGLWKNDLSLKVFAMHAYAVQASGATFMIGGDSAAIAVPDSLLGVPSDGSVTTTVTLPTGPATDGPAGGSPTIEVHGYYAYQTLTGLAVVHPSGLLTLYRLPTWQCQAGSGSGGPPIPPPTPAPQPTGSVACVARALEMTPDGAGNLWYVSSSPGFGFWQLPAANLAG